MENKDDDDVTLGNTMQKKKKNYIYNLYFG
jgi:hypothetical protein